MIPVSLGMLLSIHILMRPPPLSVGYTTLLALASGIGQELYNAILILVYLKNVNFICYCPSGLLVY